ncbi:hypothetical protein NP493_85g00000 [Ridgeia piscesae]|uniref:Uncharacterized protein n=1 Tax=Ridgeia piscesae TaxID=27915 RepID=A0AAD9P8P1_RIDPI|nr:hypothetical protein NP493_85g00000 [Ridgeia piscesae]
MFVDHTVVGHGAPHELSHLLSTSVVYDVLLRQHKCSKVKG